MLGFLSLSVSLTRDRGRGDTVADAPFPFLSFPLPLYPFFLFPFFSCLFVSYDFSFFLFAGFFSLLSWGIIFLDLWVSLIIPESECCKDP